MKGEYNPKRKKKEGERPVKLSLIHIFIPFAYFQANTKVYYNLDASLPKDLESIMANEKLQEDYHMGAAHMILMDKNVSGKEKNKMIKEMEKVDGVKEVLGLETLIGPSLPQSMIPEDIKEILESDHYELMLITNEYQTASEEVNVQIDELNKILKSYDKTGMLVGEAPCTKDLIEITDHDFKVVSAVSILAVFLIILFVFKSVTLPVILVLVIEMCIRDSMYCMKNVPGALAGEYRSISNPEENIGKYLESDFHSMIFRTEYLRKNEILFHESTILTGFEFLAFACLHTERRAWYQNITYIHRKDVYKRQI